jgi:drug/metabolite transporter (DMT)-like permease
VSIPAKAFAALMVTEVAFASLAATSKIVVTEVHPLTVAGIRVVVGGLFLAALALAVRRERVPWSDAPRLVALALLGVVFNQGLFLLGVARTTATNASILIATIPVFTVLVAIILRKERAVTLRILGIIVSFVGVAILLKAERFNVAPNVGDLFIIINALSFSFYLVLSRPLLAKYRSTTVVMWTFLVAGLFLGPIGAGLATDLDAGAVSTRAWIALAWVVLVGTVIAYAFNNYALKRLESSTVASFIFLQPLIGVALAMVLLGETLTTRTVIGGLLVVAGLLVVTRHEAVAVGTQDVGVPPVRRATEVPLKDLDDEAGPPR